MAFRPHANPMQAWAIALVTGHKYRIHWGYGLDFMKMQVDLSPLWKPTDKDVYIIHNFTDLRSKIDFYTGGDHIDTGTLLSKDSAVR